jgi:predicted transcriptional regulator
MITVDRSQSTVRRRSKAGDVRVADRQGRTRGAWKLLSDKRRGIMRAVAGAGPLSIREIPRRVGRDVRAVHSDVQLLHHAGVIDKTEDGRMVLPYKTIKFDFTFETRAA